MTPPPKCSTVDVLMFSYVIELVSLSQGFGSLFPLGGN